MSLGSIFTSDFLGFGQDRHGDGGRMDAPLAFRGRHPLHAVSPGLVLELAVDAVARDRCNDFLETAVPVSMLLITSTRQPCNSAVARVHPEHVGDEERCLLATSARRISRMMFFSSSGPWA
jgi:hypothetical protein